ncbi:MAG: TetR/AcrR family transcriptional regulator [Nitrospirae bacterium]|nr:TetR/AcrR family transcriptional regulator [Nitrospirota bacterium]
MTAPKRLVGKAGRESARRAEQKAASRQAILNAAMACFNEHGFQHTSIDAIAREARVSKGLVHYHFESKEQIFGEIQALLFRRLAAKIENASAGLGLSAERAAWAAEELWEALLRMQRMLPMGLTLLERALRHRKLRKQASKFVQEQRRLIIAGIRAVSGRRPEELGITAQALADLTVATVVGLLVLQPFSTHPSRAKGIYDTFKKLAMRFLFPPEDKEVDP